MPGAAAYMMAPPGGIGVPGDIGGAPIGVPGDIGGAPVAIGAGVGTPPVMPMTSPPTTGGPPLSADGDGSATIMKWCVPRWST